MNIKLKIALGLAFTAVAFSANAQKTYTQGSADYTLSVAGTNIETKVYFNADSSAAVTQQGPANIKILSNTKGTYVAILVDVPMVSIKKVAVLSPEEIAQARAEEPKFTFTPGTETKQINGFNCKKVTVKDTKSGTVYTAWVTKDIVAPVNSLTKYFAGAGGFPVQFTTIQQGQSTDITLKSISDARVPAGTFGIPAGFDKMSLADLSALSGK